MRTKLHPAARNTPLRHPVSGPAIRSRRMPAQATFLANVLSGGKPRYTLSEWPPETASSQSMNSVSGSTIRISGRNSLGGARQLMPGKPSRLLVIPNGHAPAQYGAGEENAKSGSHCALWLCSCDITCSCGGCNQASTTGQYPGASFRSSKPDSRLGRRISSL
jgi:hypothetical protein